MLRAHAQEGSERSESLLQTLGCLGRVGRMGRRKFAFISICQMEMETHPVAGSLRPSNKQHFQSRSQGALLPENFIAVFQDFHMKPFNTECLAKVQQCFSAAGLPVQLARLPKVAHCVLGKWV